MAYSNAHISEDSAITALNSLGILQIKNDKKAEITINSVKDFQRKMGIADDGDIGPVTANAMKLVNQNEGFGEEKELIASAQKFEKEHKAQKLAADLLKPSVTDSAINLNGGKNLIAESHNKSLVPELKDALTRGAVVLNKDGSGTTPDIGGMKPEAQRKLAAVANKYFDSTHDPVQINSGYRGPDRQADAMYTNIVKKREPSYQAKGLLAKIHETFNNFFSKGQGATIEAMTVTIAEQAEKQQFISNHMNGTCSDVALGGLHLKEIKAVLKENNVSCGYEGKAHHLHLDFNKPYLESTADKNSKHSKSTKVGKG